MRMEDNCYNEKLNVDHSNFFNKFRIEVIETTNYL